MKTHNTIPVELIKLTGGRRLLRVYAPESGLALERKLDPNEPLARQKERLRAALEAASACCERHCPISMKGQPVQLALSPAAAKRSRRA